MSAIPIVARTIGALLLALGLSSSSRKGPRDRGASSGDGNCGGKRGD